MSNSSGQSQKAVPAQLGFLAIYNPSLGTTDETLENQIVYYSSPHPRAESAIPRERLAPKAIQDAMREQNNEQLRQIGLAQGMVEFGRSFSDGRAVDTIETEKSRIVLHELESGWWILASIDLTILPGKNKAAATKDKVANEEPAVEYSSREVKPAILLLGDLLQAHSTFLLHHASSMSALFVRTRRSKFIGILGRFWDMFLSSWNVLMHGNPANSLYGGIKIAACGELGMGVGEEERGSGEREVLEGFIGRIEGLVDVMVSKFGDGDLETSNESYPPSKTGQREAKPTVPWLGSGEEPAAEDGIVFLGSGALSRKSLRDLSHWVEDIYRWGSHAYGVMDNPTSNRRSRKAKGKAKQISEPRNASRQPLHQGRSLSLRDKPRRQNSSSRGDMTTIAPTPVADEQPNNDSLKITKRRPSLRRGPSSHGSAESETKTSSKFSQYWKLGYGTHWSLGNSAAKDFAPVEPQSTASINSGSSETPSTVPITKPSEPDPSESRGHYLVGLLGNIEDEVEDIPSDGHPDGHPETPITGDDIEHSRLLLRTVTVELERAEDARAENEISIDLGAGNDNQSTKAPGSEHTNTSVTSYESQDRNKTKKLRVVVYISKPFVFVLLFELRTDALALTSLYHSLHQQISPLIKPLLLSTSYRATRPELSAAGAEDSSTPIYDLVFDQKLLTVNSTIPNIPSPYHAHFTSSPPPPWSRVEALNTHMQIINTYISSTAERTEVERTCKTSRGWWVVYCRVPNTDASATPLASGPVNIPKLIPEDSVESEDNVVRSESPRGKSTVNTSLYSGPAHPFLEVPSGGQDLGPKEKEIFLIRRASDHAAMRSASRFVSGQSESGEAGWAAGPGKLVQGIGVDTKRYIEGLLNLNR